MQSVLRLLYVKWCTCVKTSKRYLEHGFSHKGAEFHLSERCAMDAKTLPYHYFWVNHSLGQTDNFPRTQVQLDKKIQELRQQCFRMKVNSENNNNNKKKQPKNKTACPRCIIWINSLVLIGFFCGCLQCVLEHFDCYSSCVSVGVIRKDILLPGVIDGGTVSDSPHTGLVLIISSKIHPTTALGMAGHAAISSCGLWGPVRADLEVGASAGVHFLNGQLYGLPTTNGHKLLSVMPSETLIWAWVKAQTPRSTLSRWSDAESSSSILRSSVHKKPIMTKMENTGERCSLCVSSVVFIFLIN